jgi:ADP-ribose pyrophosphatase YjhB (NUDIX family)
VGAIAVEGDKLLLVRRGHDPEAGRWSVPGGRVEAGETVRRAVEREALEETGLTVCCGRLIGWVERMGPDYHFVILDFAVTVTGGNVEPGGDAEEVRWVPMADVARLPLASGLETFLRDHGVLTPTAAPS